MLELELSEQRRVGVGHQKLVRVHGEEYAVGGVLHPRGVVGDHFVLVLQSRVVSLLQSCCGHVAVIYRYMLRYMLRYM